MSLIGQSPTLLNIAFGVFVGFGLVRLGIYMLAFGHGVLDLMRNLRAYREGR